MLDFNNFEQTYFLTKNIKTFTNLKVDSTYDMFPVFGLVCPRHTCRAIMEESANISHCTGLLPSWGSSDFGPW